VSFLLIRLLIHKVKEQNSRTLHYQRYLRSHLINLNLMYKNRLIIFLLLIFQFSINAQSHNDSTLNLAIGFRVGLLINPDLKENFELTKQKIIEYGINEVRIYGGGNAIAYKYLDIEGFPEIKQEGNPQELAKYREGLKWFKDHKIRITLSGGEPSLPGVDYHTNDKNSFFNIYPEAKYLSSGLLWKFYEERTYALFKTFPEVDATDYFLWETPTLDDLNYFPGIKWQKEITWHKGENQYYSQADYLTEFMTAIIRGANRANKKFSILTFSHYPYQEKILLESLKELEIRNESFLMVHKSQPGDWDPYKGPNNIMMQTQTQSSLLFDGVGEYWGRSLVPYCFPEEIQTRVLHALRNNKNIHTLAMRTYWDNDQTLFNNYNEINLFALSRFAKNPSANVEQIWKDWANEKFGELAAPKVITALKRTNEIGNLVYYFRGIWVQEHSKMASLDYMTAQVLHTGKAMIKWNPSDIKNNDLIKSFLNKPNEELIKLVLADRKQALKMCQESLVDIESARKDLSVKEYRKLKTQMILLKDFVELSMPHIESYLRYIIDKNDPTPENLKAINRSLDELTQIAKEMDKKYENANFLISGSEIRKFVLDVRLRIGKDKQ